jgi:hypothetical protein
MPRHSFKFEQHGPLGRVSVDGHDISAAVHSLTIHGDADMYPRVTLDLKIHDITTVSSHQTEVLIPDSTAEALIALGWTPPASEGRDTTTLKTEQVTTRRQMRAEPPPDHDTP